MLTSTSTYNFTFTGKERDEETGFTYHGARYFDAALLTSWMAVDPMSDKYPSLSPYNYCAWNPVRLVDEDGMEIYPTKRSAENDRAIAIKLFGEDNVSAVYNKGTEKKPNYVFNVHTPKSIDSRHRVRSTISSSNELRKYEFSGAPRRNVISGSLSIGFQCNVGVFGINLSSIDLASINLDLDSQELTTKTPHNGSADASMGINVYGFSYAHNFSGGDYVDQSSRTHSYGLGPVSVNWTNGDVAFSANGSLILGYGIGVISKIIK